ncbi:MAG: hypothetical protein ABI234_09870 [Ktedonobacteraceae bacterium]
MFTSIVPFVRRSISWLGCGCLVILVCALAACGGSSTSSTPSTSDNATSSSTANSTDSGNSVNGVSTASSVDTAISAGTATSVGTTTSAGTATSVGTTTAGKMTITIKENKSADGKDAYVFDPATITVKKGETVTIHNSSDKLQTIDQGDAAKAGVDAVVSLDKSGTVIFNKVGTFTLKSTTGATITVIVQ